jgi:hypothetical protein
LFGLWWLFAFGVGAGVEGSPSARGRKGGGVSVAMRREL